jgi:predicted nucleic acid-binding protein
MILVDTNVLLDLVGDDIGWAQWSSDKLQAAALEGPLLINSVIYAEVSVRYQNLGALDSFVEGVGLELAEIPRAALFLAGKAFSAYRKAGGIRTSVLPDFFIGAHAAMLEIPILTRDVRRYRAYFPTVDLISPPDPH